MLHSFDHDKYISSLLKNNINEAILQQTNIDNCDKQKLYELCIKNNCINIIEHLYDLLQSDTSFSNYNHKDLLGLASTNGFTKMVQFLQSKPEYKNYNVYLSHYYKHNDSSSSLYDILCVKEDKSLIKLLLDNYENDTDIAFIFVATIKEDFELAKRIYAKHNNLITIGYCNNALNFICRYRTIDEFRWLISNDNIKPLLNENHFLDACLYGKYCIVQSILDRKPAFKENKQIINTGINNCMKYDNVNIFKLLYNYYCPTNEHLSQACKLGSINIVKYLLGCDNITVDYKQYEPFIMAAKHGFLDICLELYKYGKNNNEMITIKNSYPFRKAIKYGQLPIIYWLLEKCPDCINNLDKKYIDQMQYDCRININMAIYIQSTMKFSLKSIDAISRDSILYRHSQYYRSYYLPNDSSTFWNKLPYIIIEIPKNASCSIVNSIKRKNCFGHVLAKSYPVSVRSKLKTICRNPYSRAISAYFFVKKGGFYDNEEYIKVAIDYPTFESWVLNGLTEEMTKFDHKNMWAEVFVAQIEYIIDGDRQIIVQNENIGKYESLKDDVKRLFDIDLKLHHNRSEHSDWSTYYSNPLVRDRIYELYKEDFSVFGYNKEI